MSGVGPFPLFGITFARLRSQEKTPIAGEPAIWNISRLFPGKILIDRYCPAWLNDRWEGQN
jgi:hypothetical protein